MKAGDLYLLKRWDQALTHGADHIFVQFINHY